MKRVLYWIAYVTVFVLAAAGCGIAAVGIGAMLVSCTPAEAQHREQEGKQQVGLANCITEASKLDADHDARVAAYTRCANDVDRDAGKVP